MKKIIFILIIAGGWYVNKNGWPDFVQRSNSPVITNASLLSTPTAPTSFKPRTNSPASASSFRCDGRQHCSQMRSYDEAVFFLRNCPNTKMDGDRDGVPCEMQFGR
ncbi:MAG: excalibur calcium-binding domain-containing protein [Pseudomonas sp.]|nr:excalibur calcium-binding domain-containing protein [Pseudomonas sp.]